MSAIGVNHLQVGRDDTRLLSPWIAHWKGGKLRRAPVARRYGDRRCPSWVRSWYFAPHRQCRFWGISGHLQCYRPYPLYPRKRTSDRARFMSALGQKRTSGEREFQRATLL